LWVARLKILAREAGVELIQHYSKGIVIYFFPETRVDYKLLWSMVQESAGKVALLAGRRVAVKLKLEQNQMLLPELISWLIRLRDLTVPSQEALMVK